MPWTGKSFAAKHNKKLSGASASKAASIASAIVREGGDEGVAIATANKYASKHVGKLRKRGLVSDRQHEKMEGRSKERGEHSKAHPGFAAVEGKIGREPGIRNPGAVLAAASRGASKAAHKANPRLNKVHG